MTSDVLTGQAEAYLRKLCIDIPTRRVGSAGNRAATDFFAGVVAAFGFATETPAFACMDWHEDDVALEVDGTDRTALASPYSLGCDVTGPLIAAATVEELAAADVTGAILLLHGDIARGQLMPKHFPFYNPDEHQEIIRLLESKQPLAIIAATGRDPQMVGAAYPFPLFEDGDFDIPSVYMTDVEGARLLPLVGRRAILTSHARRITATGCNVVATKGAGLPRRMVFMAHIDAKRGTPGALDNAAGVTTLLLLAELLAGYAGDLGVELVAVNGEDYYSSPGEQLYLQQNAARFDGILLGVNLDGVGSVDAPVAYSLSE